jgi:hypothetical protein
MRRTAVFRRLIRLLIVLPLLLNACSRQQPQQPSVAPGFGSGPAIGAAIAASCQSSVLKISGSITAQGHPGDIEVVVLVDGQERARQTVPQRTLFNIECPGTTSGEHTWEVHFQSGGKEIHKHGPETIVCE